MEKRIFFVKARVRKISTAVLFFTIMTDNNFARSATFVESGHILFLSTLVFLLLLLVLINIVISFKLFYFF